MSVVRALVARNVRIFLRDKTAVFFSLLSVLIIIGLYLFFLGEMQVNSIKRTVGDVKGIRFLIDSWIMAGIIIVNSVTVALGVLGRIVIDEEDKLLRDFLVAPISRPQLIAGYLISSWAIGIMFCLINISLGFTSFSKAGGCCQRYLWPRSSDCQFSASFPLPLSCSSSLPSPKP